MPRRFELARDARPVVLHLQHHRAVRAAGADMDRRISHAGGGLYGVAHQVDHDLLHLHGVDRDRRQVGALLAVDADAVALAEQGEVDRLVDQRVDFAHVPLRLALLDELAHALDDVAGALSLARRLVEDFPDDLDDVDALGVGAPYCLQVEHQRGERLVELMGDGCAHLVDSRDAGEMHELALQVGEALLALLARAQVAQDADELPPVRRRRLADRQFQREDGAVGMAPAYLAADADDLLHAGADIAAEILVVLPRILDRHDD
ncbi:MAG: hypothetical protein K0R27_5201, partial [Xanthobacteraceae bacterium]|nr:hypothetical protein [Xanthobacteraceae bacterium]